MLLATYEPSDRVSSQGGWVADPEKSIATVADEVSEKVKSSCAANDSRFPAPTAGTPSDTDTDDDNDPRSNDCGAAAVTFILYVPAAPVPTLST